MIIFKKLAMKRTLVGLGLGIILSASIISGCTVDTGLEDSQDSDRAKVSQDVSEREGGDSGSEHSSKPESNESSRESGDGVADQGPSGDSGNESSEGGGEEHSDTNTLALREGGDSGGEHGGRREDNELRSEHGSGGDGSSEGSHGGSERDKRSRHVEPGHSYRTAVERCSGRTGCFDAVRCSNPVCTRERCETRSLRSFAMYRPNLT